MMCRSCSCISCCISLHTPPCPSLLGCPRLPPMPHMESSGELAALLKLAALAAAIVD